MFYLSVYYYTRDTMREPKKAVAHLHCIPHTTSLCKAMHFSLHFWQFSNDKKNKGS